MVELTFHALRKNFQQITREKINTIEYYPASEGFCLSKLSKRQISITPI